ncbi:mCG13775, isoform CRA_b, partial [Mus musculus]
ALKTSECDHRLYPGESLARSYRFCLAVLRASVYRRSSRDCSTLGRFPIGVSCRGTVLLGLSQALIFPDGQALLLNLYT